MKKISIINIIAAVLALAGVIVAFASHAYSEANQVSNVTLLILAGAVAVVLSVLPSIVKNNIVSLLSPIGAIALMMYVFNMIISERILMIAGIFSYNSQDKVGWNVFYIVVAAAVCLVLACVANIISAFRKDK